MPAPSSPPKKRPSVVPEPVTLETLQAAVLKLADEQRQTRRLLDSHINNAILERGEHSKRQDAIMSMLGDILSKI